MIKKKYTKVKLDFEDYVNKNTGEVLSSEYDVTSFNVVNNDVIIISSNEYIVIDSKARAYIEANFTTSEQGSIWKMTDMVYGCFNLLCDKNKKPHTKDSLEKTLDYARSTMHGFLKKLYEKSVIYYIEGYKNKKKCTWIMLNPTLARKQKTFRKECLEVFTDLSKKI
jgi:hypothetical protein